jgi:hypothetical protein
MVPTGRIPIRRFFIQHRDGEDSLLKVVLYGANTYRNFNSHPGLRHPIKSCETAEWIITIATGPRRGIYEVMNVLDQMYLEDVDDWKFNIEVIFSSPALVSSRSIHPLARNDGYGILHLDMSREIDEMCPELSRLNATFALEEENSWQDNRSMNWYVLPFFPYEEEGSNKFDEWRERLDFYRSFHSQIARTLLVQPTSLDTS